MRQGGSGYGPLRSTTGCAARDQGDLVAAARGYSGGYYKIGLPPVTATVAPEI